MKFSKIAEIFLKISNISARNEIIKVLSELYQELSPREAQIISYFFLGALRPPYKVTQFNLAEKSLLKIIASVLEEPVTDIEKKFKISGNLPSVLQEGKWHPIKNLTLEEVYNELELIEKISGTGSQEERAKALHSLLISLDPLSASYSVGIILGNLRLGFSDMTIIDALSWMLIGSKKASKIIEHAYNLCSDIGLITYTVKEGGLPAIEKIQPHIGIPIRPAAAERLNSPTEIIEKIGECIAQPKLDGFRLQVHLRKIIKHEDVHFFSRNLIDMTNMFPDLAHEFKKLLIDSLIIDGEAIGYEEETGIFSPFQETVKRKRKHGIEEATTELPLKFFAFDILYLNGKSTMDLPHHDRRALLVEVFKKLDSNKISVIPEKKIHTAQELKEYFQENIQAGLEGLVVKRKDGTYQPGKRNFNWIKLKRHEHGHLEDTIDAVILGYYAGQGKRAGFGIGALLVGIFNQHKDKFQTVAKIGTGLKDEDWVNIKKMCDKLKIDHKPNNVECAKELTPDVWITPHLVVETRADEITLSPLHTAGKTEEHSGFALRFPRFIKLRSDKAAKDATNIDELKQMYSLQKKLTI